VATTRSSASRGREQARHATGPVAAEHAGKVYGGAIGGVAVILAFLILTSTGHVIDAAVQHFMLFYAGVFTLIALSASVALGFVATDRLVLSPGHRVFIQSAHRAVSFGALAFLVIHIVTEIVAQRSHVIDALIPFLSPYRTFYIGLGTIASDLVVLLVVTSIARKRFTTDGNAWKWRAIHYTAYASLGFGVWHGLLGGRPGASYVDWAYGFVIAFVVLGLVVRIIAGSLRPKETLSTPPAPDASAGSGSAPLRAASMFAQLQIARTGAASALPASRQGTGAMPALAAPVIGGASGTAPPAGPSGMAQPVYEPGYDGPPRYRGAPRRPSSGPMPRATTGAMPRVATGPLPMHGDALPRRTTGPIPRAGTGPMPRAATGPFPGAGPARRPAADPRLATGPLPATGAPPAAPPPWPQAGQLHGTGRPVPWDQGISETDPGLRYREPGPGMPGYRGGTPSRGADPYAGDPYAGNVGDGGDRGGHSAADIMPGWDRGAADGAAAGVDGGNWGHDGYGWDGWR
jgi:DMSO/TMAO reductase YedYZ heme-binding membrane subunit